MMPQTKIYSFDLHAENIFNYNIFNNHNNNNK